MATNVEIEREIHKLIRHGLSDEQIVRAMKSQLKEAGADESSVYSTCKDYPDYDLIQLFMRSKIIVDKDGEDDKLYLYDAGSKKLEFIDSSRLVKIISPKLDWNHKRYTCKFDYNPYKPFKLKKIDGQWVFNLYNPPPWKEAHFYSKGRIAIEPIDELPEIYDRFFTHLVAGDAPSFEYLINWMANMEQARNYCILCTIGTKGIGKGVLGEIMRKLVGEQNYQLTDNRIINKDFNGQLLNKRLAYLNEVKVVNDQQANKLKSLIDDFIEVEKKGVDAKTVQNHCSIYFSSNQLDSIPITSDNRRFSILELTDVQLPKVMSGAEIKSLTSDENIDKLARYLYGRKVNEDDMLKVFVSERTQTIIEFGLDVWQDEFRQEYLPNMRGQTKTVREVSEDIKELCDLSRGPGRKKLQLLAAKFANEFEVKNIRHGDAQKWCVIFK